jgi:putative membrane protein
MNIWVDANGWPFPPIVLLGCLIAEILYFRGWRLLVKAKQSRVGYGQPWFWRGACFLGAIVVFLLASSAPIDILSGRFFWVHMVQHLLFLVVMAPLLVAGAPLLPMWLGLPRRVRRLTKAVVRPGAWYAFYRVGQWLQQPALACALMFIGMWAWHWPALYDLALTNYAIHDWCEHTTFLVVSMLFWALVIPPPPLRPRLGYLGRLRMVGIAIVQNIALAGLIGFAPAPLYAPYAHLALAGGLSALQDQQLGAGIMWTVGDLPFVIALSILVQRWLASQSDKAGMAIEMPTVERE